MSFTGELGIGPSMLGNIILAFRQAAVVSSHGRGYRAGALGNQLIAYWMRQRDEKRSRKLEHRKLSILDSTAVLIAEKAFLKKRNENAAYALLLAEI